MAVLAAWVLGLSAAAPAVLHAKAFLAKDEALSLAFPGAERVEDRVVFLTEAQQAAVQRLARAPLESRLWTIHVGWRGSEILGYAIIDSHVVRTLPETFMVVIEPGGTVRRVEVLAFHEPSEYLPTVRWMEQFHGRALDEDLKLRGAIQGITGATLSAQAMTAGVRRALALWQVAVAQPATPAATPVPGPVTP